MISTKTYKPVRYFAVTFTASFAFWFAGAYASFHERLQGLYMVFMLPGLMAPCIVSAVMTFSSGERQMRRDFLNRLFNLRLIRLRMVPVILFLMPLVVVVSALLSLTVGGPLSQFQPTGGFSFSTGSVPVLLLLLMAATFEELGWRGYAFDSLQSRYGYLKASLIFGILWSVWHAPLLFVRDSYQYEILQQNRLYAINFFVAIVPLGVIINWVWARNGKSIPVAIVFHLAINLSQELLAITQTTKMIQTAVLAAVATIIAVRDRELFAERRTAGKTVT